jgi:hypothetical protein
MLAFVHGLGIDPYQVVQFVSINKNHGRLNWFSCGANTPITVYLR